MVPDNLFFFVRDHMTYERSADNAGTNINDLTMINLYEVEVNVSCLERSPQ